MIPVKPDARRIILLEATIVTYLLILQDQRVEWEQQQKGRPTSTWCVPMCAAWVETLCITQIPGEYRINFISLLILLILFFHILNCLAFGKAQKFLSDQWEV